MSVRKLIESVLERYNQSWEDVEHCTMPADREFASLSEFYTAGELIAWTDKYVVFLCDCYESHMCIVKRNPEQGYIV